MVRGGLHELYLPEGFSPWLQGAFLLPGRKINYLGGHSRCLDLGKAFDVYLAWGQSPCLESGKAFEAGLRVVEQGQFS